MNNFFNWLGSQPWYIESFIFYGGIATVLFFFAGIQKSEKEGVTKLTDGLLFIFGGFLALYQFADEKIRYASAFVIEFFVTIGRGIFSKSFLKFSFIMLIIITCLKILL